MKAMSKNTMAYKSHRLQAELHPSVIGYSLQLMYKWSNITNLEQVFNSYNWPDKINPPLYDQ